MTWNPKGVFFWLTLFAMAVCLAIAFGPIAGAVFFGVLAFLILLIG